MRYQFTIGIGRDKVGNLIPRHEWENAHCKILTRATDVFGGCTSTRGEGAWRTPGKKVVVKDCLIITVDCTNGNKALEKYWEEKAVSFAEFCRDLLNQSCVLLSIQESIVRFI